MHIDAGSRLGRIFGGAHVATCHHHQSVADHPGYRAVASADDGLLEAFELPGERFALGVQWHPEAGNDRALFQAFADAARAYAAGSRRVHALATDATGANIGKRREPDPPGASAGNGREPEAHGLDATRDNNRDRPRVRG